MPSAWPAPVSAKMKALLAIAAAVTRSGRTVTTGHAAGAQRLLSHGYLPPPADPGGEG
jgi:hypothetical protein